MNSILSNPQTIGLIYDVVGILILGIPLALRGRLPIVMQQATQRWDFSLPPAKEIIAARWDATFGTLVLAFGFALQIVAQYCAEVPPGCGVGLFVGLLTFGALYCFWFRRYTIERQMAKVAEQFEEKEREAEVET